MLGSFCSTKFEALKIEMLGSATLHPTYNYAIETLSEEKLMMLYYQSLEPQKIAAK